jgi:hypothetical protein
MAHDVFISHSAKDKTTADAVCAMLESNGVRCWIAPRDVTPGMEWGQCIIEAIEQSRIMILVFTAHANESSQIRREIERAVNHGVAILPVRIEDVLPGKALEFFIGNVHWLDALTPPLENHLKNLAGTVKVLLERMGPRNVGPILHDSAAQEAATKGPTSPTAASVNAPRPIFAETSPEAQIEKRPSRRRWLRVTLISAAVVILVLLALAFFIPSGSQRIVRDPSRLELALVASFSPNQTGAPLLNYDGSSKMYGVDRYLTSPGDIESVAATKDVNGTPALEIRLTDAAVKRMNSGAEIVGHDMALVLDGRTILTAARVQSGLGSVIMMTGNFSSGDINRLLDAISSGAPANH